MQARGAALLSRAWFLSKVLDDVTMRLGEHDMRVFGTGTLAALKSKSAYISFAASHCHFYNELENRLDDAHRKITPGLITTF